MVKVISCFLFYVGLVLIFYVYIEVLFIVLYILEYVRVKMLNLLFN